MPLSFDPQSLLAPGGVVSGLNDIGSAVVTAMNRRAERKYAAEAAAKKAAIEQSQLDQKLKNNLDVTNATGQNWMDRVQEQQTGANWRAGAHETGETVRDFINKGAQTLQSWGRNAASVLQKAAASHSVDGKNDIAEQNSLQAAVKNATVAAQKAYPEPPQDALGLSQQISGKTDQQLAAEAADRSAKRQQHILAALHQQGYEMGPTGSLTRVKPQAQLPQAPQAQVQSAPPAAPGVQQTPGTTGTVVPSVRPSATPANPKIQSIRAQLKAKGIDDTKYTDEQLAARYKVQ